MIVRNFAFFVLVVTTTTVNYTNADRTKLRGGWQVGDTAKDTAADTTATLEDAKKNKHAHHRHHRHRDLKKKDDKKGGSGSSKSKDAGDRAKKQYDPKDETAVVNNYADGLGWFEKGSNLPNSNPPAKNNNKDKKDNKKSGSGNDKKKNGNKNQQTGPYAGTFNYGAVRPTAWNPSNVAMGSAQSGKTNYASPGAATGNLVSSTNVGPYSVQKYQASPPVVQNGGGQTNMVVNPAYGNAGQVPIATYPTNPNQQAPINIAPPATTANNGQGQVVATSANRGSDNQGINFSGCSMQGCCRSSACATGCCNYQYGCTEIPTQSWMAKYASTFCMAG